jgi:hypothetical protein
MKYIYTVWFNDASLPAEDPDFDWPACFIVDAKNQLFAKKWGDYLSLKYAQKNGMEISSSDVKNLSESSMKNTHALPEIEDGQEAGDDVIGW